MKGAIASVEIFARNAQGESRRLTLTITEPERNGDEGWSSRVALADVHRPREWRAADSVSALAQALACARSWLDGLRRDGYALHRDRAGKEPFELS